ncbi:complement resistance protein TraT [Cetobacterium somerae]|uniref:complement resistance protein TraT n=1 Tax=Cetobacterium sp. NK01 TaxID=2993530 RepID=UPI002115DB36|nr:complement resistance protein TraT [Cetobacterium sp. NK01]MCQ8213026.1 complement resistance protein TraT [Cetobacterium sp. NK01]
MKKLLLLIVSIVIFLTGCSSVNTIVKKRNLEVQTQMSETIWLNPEFIGDKTIFVQIKNTTPKKLTIEQKIKTLLISKGYKITNDPKKANYWLQVNILKLNKEDLRNNNPAEAGLVGAGVGGALGAYNTGSVNSAIGLGLVGGVVATAADALVEDVYYAMVTDIVISEKTNKKVIIDNVNLIKQGTRGIAATTSVNSGNMNKYQTRVVSTANKVNLKFEEATPLLEVELINAISNIF